jgi:type II secretory pathway component PulF
VRRLRRLLRDQRGFSLIEEPCIILVMGLVVGFIVVAMLMAILSVTDIPL